MLCFFYLAKYNTLWTMVDVIKLLSKLFLFVFCRLSRFGWIFFYNARLSCSFFIFLWVGMQLQVHALTGFFCFVEGGMPVALWVIHLLRNFHFLILLIWFTMLSFNHNIIWICHQYLISLSLYPLVNGLCAYWSSQS